MARRPRIARLLDRFSRWCFLREFPVCMEELEAYVDKLAALD